MSMNSKEARGDVLNPTQRSTVEAVNRGLKAVIPAEFFAQAKDIVADHRTEHPGNTYMMAQNGRGKDEYATMYERDIFMTVRKLAEISGFDRETMRLHLLAEGVEMRRPGPQNGYEIIKLPTRKIVKGYRNKSSTTLASEHDVTPPTILRRVKNAGDEVRPRGGIPLPLPMDEIAAKYMGGATLEKLAKKHKTNKMTLHNRLKNRPDVKLRPPGPRPKLTLESK